MNRRGSRHRCTPYVSLPDQPREAEFNRGELRLMAEVLATHLRGGWVPALVYQRAKQTIERLGHA